MGGGGHSVEHREDAVLCQHLLRRGLVPVGVLVACAEEQRRARGTGAAVPHLWELLERRGALPADVLEAERRAATGRTAPRKRRRPWAARSSGRWRPGWGSLERDGVGPGDRLGCYEVLEPVARGSMGAVFAARCRRTDRQVAIKVMAGDRARRDRGAQRFLREAQLLCSLRHEGLVQGIAFGADAGRPYFVMEYVDGPSLKHEVVRRGALPEDEVAALGAGVAEALAYLHAEDIVHRDVKPANILVGRDRRPRLCDLGLARDLGGESEATASGDTLGTPCYMAPEQARGSREAGPPADLYSLGVTLFHAAAGRPPFPEGSGIIVLSRHLFDEIPDIRAVRPQVSPELARLIWDLTRKEPGRRCASAADAAARLAVLQRPRRQAA